MKKLIAYLNLFMFILVSGCSGILHCPEPLKFYRPPEEPFPHVLAIGKFVDKSFAIYPLFITGNELQELFQDELQKNRVFEDAFAVRIKKKEDQKSIDEKALLGNADLIMDGEISESECHFLGSNVHAIPMYLLIASFFGFPLGFNIKAQTWEANAEVIYHIREIKTDRTLFSRRVSAKAYRNFSIWEERTERQINKNYVRRMLTPPILQNLKAAIAQDICKNFNS